MKNLKQTEFLLWFKGKLDHSNPEIEHYCKHTLAQHMRSSDIQLRHTIKMMGWFMNPDQDLVHPITIKEHQGKITGVHPGQSRMLAACILKRAWPARVLTDSTSTALLIRPISSLEYRANQYIEGYARKLEKQLGADALMLENKYAHCDAWQFYHSVHDWVVAKRC